MKKVLVTILALVYLGVTSGIAMEIHYCMGKFSSADLFGETDKCGKCGMKTKNGCCKDEFKLIKLQDSHKLISSEINISQPVAAVQYDRRDFNVNISSAQALTLENNNSPPPVSGFTICILNCVFRK